MKIDSSLSSYRKTWSAFGSMRMAVTACLLLSAAPFAMGAADNAPAPAAPAAKPAPAAASAGVPVIPIAKLKDAVDKGKGKVVVVNFWATFCPPCVKEMPEFDAFYKSHQGKDVVLISANCDDPKDAVSAVAAFLKEKKITFPVNTIDAAPEEVSKALGIKWEGNLPYTIVYDPAGKLVKTWEEDITAKDLSAVVDPLLPKKSTAK